MRSLLLEGGVAGHMNHLYDNPNLTFRKMKEIMAAASDGQLEGTEKTDGQNLQLSYDVNTNTARAARNKGNIKDGGLDAAALAAKFGGRGALEDAFNDAFAAFEEAVNKIPQEEREEIFGPNVNIYYNAEVQDPRAANLINYDLPTLTIHRVGHREYNRETGNATDRDVTNNAQKLSDALDVVQGEREEGKFKVQMNAIRKLEALSDDVALNDAYDRLDSALTDAGISDNQTVGEYLVSRIAEMIDAQVPGLSDETKIAMMKRIFKEKGSNIRNVVATIPKEDEDKIAGVRNMVQNASLLKFEAIAPIEAIVHDFSVEMLKGVYSAFILDNDAEVIRLRSEVEKAIRAIEGSDSKEAIEILTKQMSKLKDVDNVSTAAEGFVFDYDDVTYKFTGNFAPVNQILGLFKYGRGNVPPLQKLDEQEGEVKRKIAVFPGAFKPPHRGHMNVVEELLEQGVDQVVILVSRLDRKTPAGRPVNRSVSERIWQIYIDSKGLGDRVSIGESPFNAPVTAAYEVLKGTVPDLIPQPGDLIIPAASDKPDNYGKPDYDRFKNFHKGIKGMIKGVIPANIMNWYYKAPDEAPMSASAFRAALDTGEGLEAFLPTDVDPDDVLDVLGVKREPEAIDEAKATTYTLNVTYNSGKVVTVHKLGDDAMKRALLKISRRPMVKSVTVSPPPKSMLNKKVDEISTMAGGSVEGYAVGNKNKRSLIREEDPEDEVVEEILNYLLGKGALS